MKKIWVCGTLLGLALAACQENRIEPKTPQELTTDNLSGGNGTRNGNSQDASESNDDERVTPPGQITGAYLTGTVLTEKTVNSVTEARVGLVTYYRGKKVADDPARYNVSFTAAYVGAEAGISVTYPASDAPGYDRMVVVTGGSSRAVAKAYSSTMIYLTIVDSADWSTETVQFPVSNALSSTTAQSTSQVNTSTSTSTSTSGTGTNGASGANGTPASAP